MTTDERTDQELRQCMRVGDAPARVHAAFELGRRLGAEVAGELSLYEEPDAGVRRHWLTILASYGEREAVRAIAEHHDDDTEGEHAIHLAMQLGEADPVWLAERFNAATERMRGFLLSCGAPIAWQRTIPVLEELLGSDFKTTRQAAAKRLLELQPTPGSPLCAYAVRATEECPEALTAWAEGRDHERMLDHLPIGGGYEDHGLAALLAAGRRYPLDKLRDVAVAHPRAFCLVARPVDRAALWAATTDVFGASRSISNDWLLAARQVLAAPWSAEEEKLLARWAADAAQWWEDHEHWAHDFEAKPVQVELLEALHYPDGAWRR